jgi:D-alanyl-D-alanine carboxypeptidase
VRAHEPDSDNFTAEMLLKHLGTLDGRVGTSARGAAVVIAEMRAADIPTAGVRLVDGSGLSSLDRMTAANARRGHPRGSREPGIREAFVGSLAVAGRSGTLRARLPRYRRRAGKTGTTTSPARSPASSATRSSSPCSRTARPSPTGRRGTAQDRFVLALASSLRRSASARP